MKQLLKGGTVVSGSGAQRADVLVEGEKILEVAPGYHLPGGKDRRLRRNAPLPGLYRRAHPF